MTIIDMAKASYGAAGLKKYPGDTKKAIAQRKCYNCNCCLCWYWPAVGLGPS